MSSALDTGQPTGDYSSELHQSANKIFKGSAITFFGSLAGKGALYLLLIVLSRALGAEAVGLFVLGLALLNLASIVSMLGLHTGALRYASIYYGSNHRERLKGTVIQAVAYSFAVGIIFGVLVFLSAGFIAEKIFKSSEIEGVIRAFSIAIPFLSSLLVTANITRASKRMQYFIYIKEFFQPGLGIIFIILLSLIGLKLYSAAVAWDISIILGFLFALFLTARVFPEVIDRHIRPSFNPDLVKFSLPLMGIGLLQFLILWTDTLMLGYFRPMGDVGIYRVAAQTALILILFLTSSNAIFGPILAELYSKRKKEINNLFKITTKWTFYSSFIAFIIIIFSRKEIMQIFGPEFIAGTGVLLLLATAQLVNCGTGGVGYALIMSGRERLEFTNTALVALLNILLNILLIPVYGMLGAAMATGISIAAISVIRLVEGYRVLNLFPYHPRFFKGIGAGVFVIALLYLINPWLSGLYYILNLGVTVLLAPSLFTVALLVLKLDEEDTRLLAMLKSKLAP